MVTLIRGLVLNERLFVDCLVLFFNHISAVRDDRPKLPDGLNKVFERNAWFSFPDFPPLCGYIDQLWNAVIVSSSVKASSEAFGKALRFVVQYLFNLICKYQDIRTWLVCTGISGGLRINRLVIFTWPLVFNLIFDLLLLRTNIRWPQIILCLRNQIYLTALHVEICLVRSLWSILHA